MGCRNMHFFGVYNSCLADTTTHFEAYMGGTNESEISVTLAVEAIIFLIFACFLEVVSR